MRTRRPVGVHPLGVEQSADGTQWLLQVAVALALDGRRPRGGAVEPENHSHRGGLTRTVRSEKAGHDAGFDGEGEVVDRRHRSVLLGQSCHFDHGTTVPDRRRVHIAPQSRLASSFWMTQTLRQPRPGWGTRSPERSRKCARVCQMRGDSPSFSPLFCARFANALAFAKYAAPHKGPRRRRSRYIGELACAQNRFGMRPACRAW